MKGKFKSTPLSGTIWVTLILGTGCGIRSYLILKVKKKSCFNYKDLVFLL